MKRFVEGEITQSRSFLLATVYRVAEKMGLGFPYALHVERFPELSGGVHHYRVYARFGRNGDLPLEADFKMYFLDDFGRVNVKSSLGFGLLSGRSSWRVELKAKRRGQKKLTIKKWRWWHRFPRT